MMNQQALAAPVITATDRLGLTLFFAVALHAIIILGITFSDSLLKKRDSIQTMEVTLVQSRSDKSPDKAQFLAQANQQGSGNSDNTDKPTAPQKQQIATPHTTPGTAPEHSVPIMPSQKIPVPREQAVMTVDNANRAAANRPQTERQKNKTPTASQMIARSLQIAALSAEVEQSRIANQRYKPNKYINASTTEFKYALYQDAWRQKVERIGKINYPEEARRRKLYGNLVLTVILRPNGTVLNIYLDKSSGSKILDDAAKRIVRLASPFAPFPDDIRAETNQLHITRSWIFHRGNRLTTK